MGLSAEHQFNAPRGIYSHEAVQEMFGKGELCTECLAQMCCINCSTPSGLPSLVCTQKGRHCLSGAPGVTHSRNLVTTRLLIYNCHCSVVMPEPKCTWYNFFGIKICGVSEKVKCFYQNALPCNFHLG